MYIEEELLAEVEQFEEENSKEFFDFQESFHATSLNDWFEDVAFRIGRGDYLHAL
ncbi:hypothetical protein [Pseudolactococcus insecticola]|uniref:Uncharacterized protein n=1 Tax=Pseudolactococcus insecticola TaxID=2709158 RepID=A0A6A0B9K9_9LACT|nr:hypothetical protein [Lactococcus insecticola]GFH41303.1 hypothetical protein Hs20B_17010 [Lactococcus insecticola]